MPDDYAFRADIDDLAAALRREMWDAFHPEFLADLAAALPEAAGALPEKFRGTMTAGEARVALDCLDAFTGRARAA